MSKPKIKLRVRYEVVFEAVIEVDDRGTDDLEGEYSDEIADINIPEDEVSQYEVDTYEVERVTVETDE